VSGYLALAKKANKVAPVWPGALTEQRERKLEEANRRGLIVRWSEHPTWIKLHDPTTGEWHEVRASECLPSIVAEADKCRKKGGTT
jgi:hypothetical protein